MNSFRGFCFRSTPRDEVVLRCSNSNVWRQATRHLRPDYTTMFDRFRMRYGEEYNGVGEESVRFDHVKASVDVIRTSNAKTLTCWLRPPSSPTQRWKNLPQRTSGFRDRRACGLVYPVWKHTSTTDLFWRHLYHCSTQGVVTHVKNQGCCGSGRSFSTRQGNTSTYFMTKTTAGDDRSMSREPQRLRQRLRQTVGTAVTKHFRETIEVDE